MAITTSSSIKTTLTWTQKDEESKASTRDQVTIESDQPLTNGTGDGQANTVWFKTDTLASGANVEFDLYDLQRNVLGSQLTTSFENGSIKLASVVNSSTGDQSIALDNSQTNGFTRYSDGAAAVINIPAGGSFTFSNPEGWDVSAANRYLRIIDGGNAATYEIGLVGTS